MASTPEEFQLRLNRGPAGLRRRLDALSPSRFVDQMRAPLLLVHGINDPVIPAQQTIEFAEAARRAGLDCSVTILRMYGHVHPILPDLSAGSVLGFYLPEAFRFLKVVNRIVGEL
jgi:dipeptidyl aminopeptidase/acylaminoacyl peptidase